MSLLLGATGYLLSYVGRHTNRFGSDYTCPFSRPKNGSMDPLVIVYLKVWDNSWHDSCISFGQTIGLDGIVAKKDFTPASTERN